MPTERHYFGTTGSRPSPHTSGCVCRIFSTRLLLGLPYDLKMEILERAYSEVGCPEASFGVGELRCRTNLTPGLMSLGRPATCPARAASSEDDLVLLGDD